MPILQSFAPIADEHSTILILGSMPGAMSIRSNQYYAHPQNAFWRILGTLCSFDPALSYTQKILALNTAHIAVWDVLHSCTREGSLDSNINITSQVANDFQSFFARYHNITHLFFNGAMAEKSYLKLVLPHITDTHIKYSRLPSTSPANASIPYKHKLEAWAAISHALSKTD